MEANTAQGYQNATKTEPSLRSNAAVQPANLAPVEEQRVKMGVTIGDIEEEFGLLEHRLEYILNPDSKVEGQVTSKGPELTPCGLAIDLKDKNARLLNIKDRIRTLTRRIEL